MSKKKLERIAVILLSVIMMLTSTGIASSLALNVNEDVSSSVSSSDESTSTQISTESSTENTENSATNPDVNNSASDADTYEISSAEEFISAREKLKKANGKALKLVLTANIDFSEIPESDYLSNGSIINASKTSVFVFEGNGHKISGLNFTSGNESVSIFGYIGVNSSVKDLKIVKPLISLDSQIKNVAVVASENDGIISNVTVDKPVVSFKSAEFAGLIAAVNRGNVTGSSVIGICGNTSNASAENFTVSGTGTIGAVVGANYGKITSVSALNIGAYLKAASSIYGGIVGANSGTVSNCASTGNASGSDNSAVAGGIVGKAVTVGKAASNLTNNYTLVCITVSGYAIIGANGSEDMLHDCYMSSAVSGKYLACDNAALNKNDISKTGFKVVQLGTSEKIAVSDIDHTWGKASIKVNGNPTASGSGIEFSLADSTATVKGVKANTVSTIKYPIEIKLPSTVGADGSVVFTQKLKISVLVVPKGSVGDGSVDNPLEITGSGMLAVSIKLPYISVKLVKDVNWSSAPIDFGGVLDGNGKSIAVSSPIMKNVYGNVKNLSVNVVKNLTDSIFGKAINAVFTDVSVANTDDSSFELSKGNSGAFSMRLRVPLTLTAAVQMLKLK